MQYSTVITNDITMTSCFLTAGVTVVACYATKVSLLLKQAENCPSLRVVIKLGGDITEEEKKEAFKNHLLIHTIAEVEVRRGRVREGGKFEVERREEVGGWAECTLRVFWDVVIVLPSLPPSRL